MTLVRGYFLAAAFIVTAAVTIASLQAAEHADMQAQIGAAKTSADHLKLAAQYENEAKEARAKAEEHRKMAAAYRKAVGPAAKQQLPEHCEGLVKIYEGEAKELQAMADAHRALAKAAQ